METLWELMRTCGNLSENFVGTSVGTFGGSDGNVAGNLKSPMETLLELGWVP